MVSGSKEAESDLITVRQRRKRRSRQARVTRMFMRTSREGLEHTDAGQKVTALGQSRAASVVDCILLVLTRMTLQWLHRMSNDVTSIASWPTSGRKLMNAGFLKSCSTGETVCMAQDRHTRVRRRQERATEGNTRASITAVGGSDGGYKRVEQF